MLVVVVPSVEEEEEGKVAKAERAALKAGVSVRRWRARFTLSERTLLEDFSAVGGNAVLAVLMMIIREWYV